MAGKDFSAAVVAGDGIVGVLVGVEGADTGMITTISGAVRMREAGERGKASRRRKNPVPQDLCFAWTTCRICPSKSWPTRRPKVEWKIPVA
jgi:hypothetical protein